MRSALATLTFLFALLLASACGGPAQPGGAGAATQPAPSTAPANAKINGKVLLEGRTNAGGTQVYVPGTPYISITDDAGNYAIAGVGPGAYAVMARAEGFEPATIGNLNLDSHNAQTSYTLSVITLLRRSVAAPTPGGLLGSIRGRVTTAAVGATGVTSGSASVDWSGCTIQLEGTGYRTTCAVDGAFLLWSLPPAAYQLLARMPGYETARVPVTVTSAETALEVPLALSDAGRDRAIRGFVSLNKADGSPANDFEKILVQVNGHPDLNTTIANDGSFAINKLRAGHYILSAAGDGYAPANPVDIDLIETTETEVQLTLNTAAAAGSGKANGKLHGTALKDIQGDTDMSGITVALTGSSLLATTDGDGKYSIDAVPAGKYKLLAEADGFEKATAEIEVTSGTDTEVPGLLLKASKNYPKVIGVDPADGTRNVALGRQIPITIRFNKDMSPETLRQAISLDPEVAFHVVAGKESPETDFNLVKVIIDGGGQGGAPPQYRQRYTLTIGTEAHDTENLALQEPYAMSFTLGGAEVIATNPANRTVTGALNPQYPVVISFNAPMDSGTITRDVVRISPRLDSQPITYVDEDAATGWSRLYITGIWKPDTRYRITLTSRARTLTHQTLDNTPYTFEFRTAKQFVAELPRAPRRTGDRRRNSYSQKY